MFDRLIRVLAVPFMLSVAGPAAATIVVPINGLFNTGVSTPGVAIANDATDTH